MALYDKLGERSEVLHFDITPLPPMPDAAEALRRAALVVAPIATVHASRTQPEDDFWGGSVAEIELAPELPTECLQGLDAFSHVEVVFMFHRVPESKLVPGARRPRNHSGWPQVGIFAQRAKSRPNRIGTTICRVLALEGRVLRVAELDAIDGTPVIDLKPVLRQFLPREPTHQPAWADELMAQYWSTPVQAP